MTAKEKTAYIAARGADFQRAFRTRYKSDAEFKKAVDIVDTPESLDPILDTVKVEPRARFNVEQLLRTRYNVDEALVKEFESYPGVEALVKQLVSAKSSDEIIELSGKLDKVFDLFIEGKEAKDAKEVADNAKVENDPGQVQHGAEEAAKNEAVEAGATLEKYLAAQFTPELAEMAKSRQDVWAALLNAMPDPMKIARIMKGLSDQEQVAYDQRRVPPPPETLDFPKKPEPKPKTWRDAIKKFGSRALYVLTGFNPNYGEGAKTEHERQSRKNEMLANFARSMGSFRNAMLSSTPTNFQSIETSGPFKALEDYYRYNASVDEVRKIYDAMNTQMEYFDNEIERVERVIEMLQKAHGDPQLLLIFMKQLEMSKRLREEASRALGVRARMLMNAVQKHGARFTEEDLAVVFHKVANRVLRKDLFDEEGVDILTTWHPGRRKKEEVDVEDVEDEDEELE